MQPRHWLQYLVPREEHRDPEFRRELQRLSVIGLRVIAGVCLGAPAFFVATSLLWFPLWLEGQPAFFELSHALAIALLGIASLAASFWTPTRAHARALGILVGYLVFLIEVAPAESLSFQAAAAMTMVMLVGIAALPIRPMQTLGLGLAMMATYIGFLAPRQELVDVSDPLFLPPTLLLQIVLICVALTVVVYQQRLAAFRARRVAERSFEELRQAQTRLLISENASSQARFAAALSHELNSPLGALAGAIETLIAAFQRLLDHPDQEARVRAVFREAADSVRDSSRRLKETIERMKHVTNLDRAETHVVDLNELLSDTADLLRGELERKAEVSLDLRPLPSVPCRPQQMSAVFSNLLRNAAAAIEERGRIQVVTERRSRDVILEVKDNGRGISRERLEHLFEPAFRVEGSRVATTNWGLFTSRSIIAEHGGHLEVESLEGEGTTARITLPAEGGGRVAPIEYRARESSGPSTASAGTRSF